MKMRDLLNRCIFQCPECGRLFLENEKGRLTMFTPSDTAEPERQFRILFEKLRARDCIDYAEFRIR